MTQWQLQQQRCTKASIIPSQTDCDGGLLRAVDSVDVSTSPSVSASLPVSEGSLPGLLFAAFQRSNHEKNIFWVKPNVAVMNEDVNSGILMMFSGVDPNLFWGGEIFSLTGRGTKLWAKARGPKGRESRDRGWGSWGAPFPPAWARGFEERCNPPPGGVRGRATENCH